MSLKQRLLAWADSLKQHLVAIYLVYRDPETPMLTRWLALLIVAYSLSPVDLIPDFIPIIGYLDDLLLLPLAYWLLVHSVKDHIWKRCLQKAGDKSTLPGFSWMGFFIILIWLSITALLIHWFFA